MAESEKFYHHKDCKVSSFDGTFLTHGKGKLDSYGFWSIPCQYCARMSEIKNGDKFNTHFPYSHKSVNIIIDGELRPVLFGQNKNGVNYCYTYDVRADGPIFGHGEDDESALISLDENFKEFLDFIEPEPVDVDWDELAHTD